MPPSSVDQTPKAQKKFVSDAWERARNAQEETEVFPTTVEAYELAKAKRQEKPQPQLA